MSCSSKNAERVARWLSARGEPEPKATAPGELLAWDSAHFGFAVGRVREASLDREGARRVVGWASEAGVRCLYLLARADDAATLEAAQAAGFLWVDLRLTLTRPADAQSLVPGGEGRAARPARGSDLDRLRAIARRCHTDSRFYSDPHFPRERCDALYERWIERSVEGWAQAVLVVESGDEPAGYATCHLADTTGSIALVGVAAGARGLGLGRGLVEAATDWLDRAGARQVEVVTQGRNVAAQRLYQSLGFRTSATGCWLHWWRSGVAGPG